MGYQVFDVKPYKGRIESFLRHTDISRCKRVLYIGASPKYFQLYDLFAENKCDITVVEAYKISVDELRNENRPYVRNVYWGDVTELDQIDGLKRCKPFDLFVWWHGPEHLKEDALKILLSENSMIHKFYTYMINIACPWGRYPQGAIAGNPYEVHQSSLYPEFFEELGYGVEALLKPDTSGSQLTVWKEKK